MRFKSYRVIILIILLCCISSFLVVKAYQKINQETHAVNSSVNCQFGTYSFINANKLFICNEKAINQITAPGEIIDYDWSPLGQEIAMTIQDKTGLRQFAIYSIKYKRFSYYHQYDDKFLCNVYYAPKDYILLDYGSGPSRSFKIIETLSLKEILESGYCIFCWTPDSDIIYSSNNKQQTIFEIGDNCSRDLLIYKIKQRKKYALKLGTSTSLYDPVSFKDNILIYTKLLLAPNNQTILSSWKLDISSNKETKLNKLPYPFDYDEIRAAINNNSLANYSWSNDGKFISYIINDNQTTNKVYIMDWRNKQSVEIGNGYKLKWCPIN